MRNEVKDPGNMKRAGREEATVQSVFPRERVRDQSYIKQYNIQTVLAILKRHQPISRTDIARLTGMSPTSITRIVTALLSKGLIYETGGEQRSGRGRKATYLRINDDGLYSIGIHIEKSVIRLCVDNFAGRTLYRGEMLVDGEGTPERIAMEARRLYDRMPRSIVSDPERVGAVGVCLSGAVDPWQGIVTRSGQMGWRQENVGSVFSEVFGRPACVENDVKACLIGEKARMEIPDETDTAYLLVGAGIGTAITSGGAIVRGERNEAGEIAGIPLGRERDGEVDYLKAHMVESHMVRRAQRSDPSVHSVDAILWAQKNGRAWADEIIRDFRCHLRMTLAMIDCLCNPAKIILGGSVFGKIAPQLENILADEHVCMGGNYEEACLTGAALIAMRSAAVEMIGQSLEE